MSSDNIIKDAIKVTRFLREHLANQDFCPHCRELVQEVFSNANDLNAVGGGTRTAREQTPTPEINQDGYQQ